MTGSRTNTRGLALATICFALGTFCCGLSIASSVTLELKEQPLSTALRELARQTGIQIAIQSELTEGKTAASLTGTYEPAAALAALLEGTGLIAYRINENTYGVRSVQTRATDLDRGFSRLANSESQSGNKSGTTHAQAEEMEKVQDSSPQPAGAPANRIEEIVVTAQKREQRLQDVPLSIAVLDTDNIERRGLVNVDDYLRGIPGVNAMSASFSGHTIIIRGLETTLSWQNQGSGSNVSTYFGETPTTGSAGLAGGTNVDIKPIDVERIEVLRGPQGTAFGSASLAGTVRTIPVAPKLDGFEAKVAAGYSATSGSGGDNYNAQLIGNFPLVADRIALRAVAYLHEESGFYRSRAGSDAAFRASMQPYFTGGAYSLDDFAVNADEIGAQTFKGGRLAALFKLTDEAQLTLSYLRQKSEFDDQGVATNGTFDQAMLKVAPEHAMRGEGWGVYDTDIDIANALLEYDLGWGDLTATYSYTRSDTVHALPFTLFTSALPFPISEASGSDHHAHVGEIRVATRLEGRWNFLGGIYAERLKDENATDWIWYADPALDFFRPNESELGTDLDQRKLTQKAVFGEVSYEVLRGLTLTAGARRYDYERSFVLDRANVFYGTIVNGGEMDASGTNLKGNVSYKFTDEAMAYASWAEGFRLGRPTTGLPGPGPGTCDADSDGIVDGSSGLPLTSTRLLSSDEAESFEIGTKLALLDQRLTIAADVFRVNWSGMPVGVAADPPPEGCGIGFSVNAGEARSEGVELQATFKATDNFLIDVGGSMIDAKLTEDFPGISAVAGDRLPGSPKYNANLGLEYQFAMRGYKPSLRADATYLGSFSNSLPPRTDLSGSYVSVDLSAQLTIGTTQFGLFARNLTNEDAFISRALFTNLYGYRLRPRTIGVQIIQSF